MGVCPQLFLYESACTAQEGGEGEREREREREGVGVGVGVGVCEVSVKALRAKERDTV